MVKEGILTSVFVYFNDKRYAPFQGMLPFNLNIKLTTGEVVGYLGEPDKKSGGKLSNICIAYNRLGVEFEFYSKIWESADAPLSYISFFAPIETSSICAICGIDSKKKCSVCGLVYYCGRDHQVLHWKVHKNLCKTK